MATDMATDPVDMDTEVIPVMDKPMVATGVTVTKR